VRSTFRPTDTATPGKFFEREAMVMVMVHSSHRRRSAVTVESVI
jgi:hypothetical protein